MTGKLNPIWTLQVLGGPTGSRTSPASTQRMTPVTLPPLPSPLPSPVKTPVPLPKEVNSLTSHITCCPVALLSQLQMVQCLLCVMCVRFCDLPAVLRMMTTRSPAKFAAIPNALLVWL